MREREPDAAELGEAGPFGVEDAAGDGEVGDRVSVEEEVAVAEADEESDEGEQDAGDEERIGFAGDYRADGFGIAGDPDGGLAEGAFAGRFLAEDDGAGFLGLAWIGARFGGRLRHRLDCLSG